MNFRVGQKVVRVRGPNLGSWHQHVPLTVGQTYTVRGLQNTCGMPAIVLEEVVNALSDTGYELDYDASAFRPVKTTDISVFTAMLAPEPNKRAPARGPSKKETV